MESHNDPANLDQQAYTYNAASETFYYQTSMSPDEPVAVCAVCTKPLAGLPVTRQGTAKIHVKCINQPPVLEVRTRRLMFKDRPNLSDLSGLPARPNPSPGLMPGGMMERIPYPPPEFESEVTTEVTIADALRGNGLNPEQQAAVNSVEGIRIRTRGHSQFVNYREPEPELVPVVRVSEIQSEVDAWAKRNFGDVAVPLVLDPISLLQTMGTLGRIAHLILKSSQKIRGGSQINLDELRGHITNYVSILIDNAEKIKYARSATLLDLSLVNGFRLSPFLGMIEEIGEMCDAILGPSGRELLRQGHRIVASESVDNQERIRKVKDGLGDLFVFACGFSAANEIDLESAFADTWTEVRERDWKKFPKDGRTE